MVTEAVAELKGEELPRAGRDQARRAGRRQPAQRLRRAEDLRLEAYRRLAAVTTQAEVDDIRAEWVDRYGPPPAPAEALLSVGRLRAECVRTGVREVTVARDVARISPIELKTSQRIRRTNHAPSAANATSAKPMSKRKAVELEVPARDDFRLRH